MEPLARILRVAARQYGAIGSAQAQSCGLTRHQVRHLIRAGRLAVARRSVYVVAGAPSTWEQHAVVALLACGEGAVLSYRAAGYVHGLVEGKPEIIDVTIPCGCRQRSLKGVVVHQASLLDARDTRTTRGLRVTSPVRTLVDLAAVPSERGLARALDNALLRGLVTTAVVRRYIKDRNLQRRPGVGKLIKLLDDREFGVPESELERRTLELIKEYRLPAPERQVRVGPHRVDFMYPHHRLVIEVDGRATHGTSEAFEADPVRQNELVLDGWTVLRFTWRQVAQDPDYVADTIRRAVQ